MISNINYEKFTFLQNNSDVCLLNTPFSHVIRPSIGLGILKAILNNTKLKPSVIYANLLFAEKIGIERYCYLTEMLPETTHIQDWIFADSAFPNHKIDNDAYFKVIMPQLISVPPKYLSDEISETEIIDEMFFVKQQATDFINELAQIILAQNPRIVGCSSVFSQHVSSLGILRRIKDLSPEICTLIGGFNCAGTMGLTALLEFDWVDYIFSGEADEAFYPLCKLIISEESNIESTKLPAGAFDRSKALDFMSQNNAHKNHSELYGIAKDLNKSPTPDYDDYFATLEKTSYKGLFKNSITILLECSRGCWWNRCTFCGLNTLSNIFRHKTADKVLQEITSSAEKYNISNIEFTDNILPPNYFDDLIPVLISQEKQYKFFVEIKANISKQQLQNFVTANIKWTQAGIECLNDEMLKLLDKGTTTLMNIRLLKFAIELGIDVYWHLLCDFPGEDITWLNQLAEEIPLYHHLEPPGSLSPIIFERFSKYFDNAKSYNLQLETIAALKYIYPVTAETLFKLSFYFQDKQYGTQCTKLDDKYNKLIEAVSCWQQEFYKNKSAVLIMEDQDTHLKISDTRMCAVTKNITLKNVEADILRVTESPINQEEIAGAIEKHCNKFYENDEVNQGVANLKKQKLIFQHGDSIISLPTAQRITPTKHPMMSHLNFNDTAKFYERINE